LAAKTDLLVDRRLCRHSRKGRSDGVKCSQQYHDEFDRETP